MIDDKKIETVANEYSQDNCGYSYNINNYSEMSIEDWKNSK